MLQSLFQSSFNQANSSIQPIWLLLSLLVSIGLGFILSFLYRYRSNYSRDFAIALILFPGLIAVIIFLVNGNLGTSVAVAGAFSLIKFRSPASSSRELLLVFMATALGLATGMGYLSLAISMTAISGGLLIGFEKWNFAKKEKHWQEVTIALPKDPEAQKRVEDLLSALQTDKKLETATVKNGRLELTYQLIWHQSDHQLLQQLLSFEEDWDIKLSRTIKKKKSL